MLVYVGTAESDRHEIKLPDNRIGRGASGSVYRVTDPAYPGAAAKIYHDPLQLEVARIECMIANPPQNSWMTIAGQQVPSIAWPTHLVHDGTGKSIGYLMPFVDTSRAVTMSEYVEDINALSEQDQSISLRINVARNMSALLGKLHSKRDYFIDLKPQNLQVFKETGNIALLDCDGFAIGGGKFPAPQYSRQYQAPEVLINRASPQSLSLNDHHDRFAMAVIIFQILNYGIHPFQGIPADMSIETADTDEYLKQGWYPYGPSLNPHLLPHPRSVHEYWDDKTRLLLHRAFTVSRPSERPAASEWVEHFDQLLNHKLFESCALYPTDVRHIHFKGKPCFVCEKFMKLAGAPRAQSVSRHQPGVTVKAGGAAQPESGGRVIPAKMNYASFWRRGGAHVLDGLLVSVQFVLALIIVGMAGEAEGADVATAFGTIIAILYYPLMHSSKHQATLGKKWLGLRVVDERGQRISVGRAFGRYFASFLSAILLGVGYLMVFFTARRQALHDKIAGTYVLYGGR